MFKAVFLDFYGTLVHEDDVFIEAICKRIMASSKVEASASEVGRYWWNSFSSQFQSAHGGEFKAQRHIELLSLEDTVDYFDSQEEPGELSRILFQHWQTAPLFEDALALLRAIRIPTVIVSNIDRGDIKAAIRHNGLDFNQIITSEDVRAYKPRPDIFREALKRFSLQPEDVLHVGDSLNNDITGAHNAGIRAAWINRKNKPTPQHCTPDYTVSSLTELIPLLS
jgi:2-haloalkanoic acid dehalogenase type II